LWDFPEGLNFDLGKAAVVRAKFFGRDNTKVDDPAPDERTPVVNPHNHLLSCFEIGDSHPSVEGQLLVGCRHVPGAISLAIGSETSNPTAAIP